MDCYTGKKKAIEAFNLGQFQRTLSLLNDHLEEGSKGYEFWYMKGVCLFMLDRSDEALVELDKAIELCSSFSRYFYHRFLIHVKLNNKGLADSDIETCCSLPDAKAEYFFYLAMRQFHNRNNEQARKSIQEAVDKGYTSIRLSRLEGLVYCEIQEFEKAIQSLKNVIGTKDADEYVYSAMGYSYYRMGLHEMNKGGVVLSNRGASFSRLYGELFLEAVGCFHVAIEKDPDRVSNYFYRGMAYKFIGNIESALENLSTAIRLDPTEEIFYAEWEKLVT